MFTARWVLPPSSIPSLVDEGLPWEPRRRVRSGVHGVVTSLGIGSEGAGLCSAGTKRRWEGGGRVCFGRRRFDHRPFAVEFSIIPSNSVSMVVCLEHANRTWLLGD